MIYDVIQSFVVLTEKFAFSTNSSEGFIVSLTRVPEIADPSKELKGDILKYIYCEGMATTQVRHKYKYKICICKKTYTQQE